MRRTDDLAQLKRLVIFAYVVELGSFAKAASKLKMNRSGVSEQISMLEQYLDMRLLHRTTRKLSLTSDGDAILPQAKLVAQTLKSINSNLADDAFAGRIRISTTHDFAVRWLMPKVSAFKESYADISFDFVLSDDQLTDGHKNLVEQQIDLAFYSATPEDTALVVRPILRERLQIFGSATYLSTQPSIKHTEKLHQAHWVLLKNLEQANKIQLFKQKGDGNLTLQPPHFHRVNSNIAMIEQVKMGMGLGLILPSMVKNEVATGELVPVLPSWRGQEVIFSVLYASHRQMPKRVTIFLDFLLQN